MIRSAPPELDLYNIREVAELLGVSDRTVRRYMRAGHLRPVRFTTKVVRFTRRSISELVDPAGDLRVSHPQAGLIITPELEFPEQFVPDDLCEVFLGVEDAPCEHPTVYATGERAGLCTVCGEVDE